MCFKKKKKRERISTFMQIGKECGSVTHNMMIIIIIVWI
jgi:hypothetical protein